MRSSDGAFFRAVLCVRRGQFPEAREYVERARKLLATDLAALVLESYERAYSDVVRVQQLAELEEVIDYCTLPAGAASSHARAATIRRMWEDRMDGTQRNVEVWQAVLSVRSLVLTAQDDSHTWVKFASLCRKGGRVQQSHATLVRLLPFDLEAEEEELGRQHRSRTSFPMPHVVLAYLKHKWSLGGGGRRRVYALLQALTQDLSSHPTALSEGGGVAGGGPGTRPGSVPLVAKAYQKLGSWAWALDPSLSEPSIVSIEASLRVATEVAPRWGKAWHSWALFNTAAMAHHTLKGNSAAAQRHVVHAIAGYFRSIALAAAARTAGGVQMGAKGQIHAGQGSGLLGVGKEGGFSSLQEDILRLLTLWFSHGNLADVQAALQEGFACVPIDTWLVVVPQIIARIHSNVAGVGGLIQSLLVRIGRHHPQAVLFPLLVAAKSLSAARRCAAQAVLDNVRAHSAALVEQAQLVSVELIRAAILWHEMWHEALEEASRQYFSEGNVAGMLSVFEPLHALLERQAAETKMEAGFVQAYGRDLAEAAEFCESYRRTGNENDITQAWDLYYQVFKLINKQLPSLTTLELDSVSPALVAATHLDLAVPGTYRAGQPVVTVASFAHQIQVITSKQRPRKISIHGSDGSEYLFLLKGHEDLRLDERVMQLFGLVNSMLRRARSSAEKGLSIDRYAVVPLSPNSGLIGWLPHCDTLHQLIREYRDARRTPVNAEHRLMLAFAPDYEHLTVMGKVEVFEHALESTPGDDLAKVLWLKSRSSEVWLERRTNYTRSLAVMSMVGYLLGLGDRHPSNLMLDRYSGKIIHIDFGDCFEASMNREKFPEKVPFRLTRMLVKAMEVSGIEGNFRFTCEAVMQILRSNKDSVMAMMEAFVHDPLINWRLFNVAVTGSRVAGPAGGDNEGDANEVLNDRAVAVMTRMSNKLTGRDFGGGGAGGAAPVNASTSTAIPTLERSMSGAVLSSVDARDGEPGLSVNIQVQRLILEAMSHENLCQNYIGWCPFW